MHTSTQHTPHTNWDRLWATKKNHNTDIQTIHPLSFGICQSSLGSKPCNNSPQHPTNNTEQSSMNHHWLHTNHLHYSVSVKLCIFSLLPNVVLLISKNLYCGMTRKWWTDFTNLKVCWENPKARTLRKETKRKIISNSTTNQKNP